MACNQENNPVIKIYTDQKFAREALELCQYQTPNLPLSYCVLANGEKVTDTTMDFAAAQAALNALAQ